MNTRRVTVFGALAAAVLLLAGCPATTLKDIVEKKFPDFTGLGTALKRDYITGLQPDPGFPNLHCCWVGNRTGWQKITGSWSTEEKTEVSTEVLGVLKAFSIDIKADASAKIEAKAEPFYRDQLVNIRHIGQPHCAQHETACAKKICTDALKVGTVSVTVYTEIGGSAGVGLPVGGTATAQDLVKIGGKSYSKDNYTATDIIVGYKMAATSCGVNAADTWFGDDKTLSAGLRAGETYEEHLNGFRKDLEKLNRAHALAPQRPSERPALVRTETAAPAVAVLAPPAGNVISGQVIRVTAVDAGYSPHAPLAGIVVTETDLSGQSRTRTVETDAGGGAYIALAAATVAVAMVLDGREVYSAQARTPAAAQGSSPAIATVSPYHGEAPPGMLESGGLAQIKGAGMPDVTVVNVDGKPATPLASGNGYALAQLSGEGPSHIQVSGANGLSSPPYPVTLVRIAPVERPPSVLNAGQTAQVVLRVSGTTEAVPVQFSLRSASITFTSGGMEQKVVSTGGADNLVRTSVRASRAGPYNIQYRLAGR